MDIHHLKVNFFKRNTTWHTVLKKEKEKEEEIKSAAPKQVHVTVSRACQFDGNFPDGVHTILYWTENKRVQ